jgi:hypothetical protein
MESEGGMGAERSQTARSKAQQKHPTGLGIPLHAPEICAFDAHVYNLRRQKD